MATALSHFPELGTRIKLMHEKEFTYANPGIQVFPFAIACSQSHLKMRHVIQISADARCMRRVYFLLLVLVVNEKLASVMVWMLVTLFSFGTQTASYVFEDVCEACNGTGFARLPFQKRRKPLSVCLNCLGLGKFISAANFNVLFWAPKIFKCSETAGSAGHKLRIYFSTKQNTVRRS